MTRINAFLAKKYKDRKTERQRDRTTETQRDRETEIE